MVVNVGQHLFGLVLAFFFFFFTISTSKSCVSPSTGDEVHHVVSHHRTYGSDTSGEASDPSPVLL